MKERLKVGDYLKVLKWPSFSKGRQKGIGKITEITINGDITKYFLTFINIKDKTGKEPLIEFFCNLEEERGILTPKGTHYPCMEGKSCGARLRKLTKEEMLVELL